MMSDERMTDPRELGEAPEAMGDDPSRGFGADPHESQLGPAPAVAGADRMKAHLRARLFGDDPPEPRPEPGPEPGSDDENDDENEDREHAARSGVIGGLDTEPGASVRRVGAPEPELAGAVGRFRVLDRLGSGGMGVVYSAYDPELDRKVALKLLRADLHHGMAKDDAQARLVREAQAMARLSDPNVIVVHDVGTVGDRVFVAMEYIEGETLGAWLKGQGDAGGVETKDGGPRRRRWREVLEVFLKAGSGLAAAHRAGLVHRDFKPDNVLLGKDGRVRVLDFGLARSVGDGTQPTGGPDAVKASLREQPDRDSLATPLTREGAVMGTPAYMSPEQYKGNPADARSDQFSFCVALYEGFYGVRPFEGSSLTELVTNVLEGHLRETPSDLRVPKRLLAAMRRGLAVDPEQRFGSMEALLAELRRDPGRKWRWGGLVLGVVTLTSLATLAATGGDQRDACVGQEDQLQGVWDDQARAELTRAIEGTGLAYAPRVAATTVQLLDDYTAQWVKMSADACGAALVAKGDDSEHRRRRQCLDQRLAEVDALVDALREPDAGMAEAAVKATASLTTGLSACADPRRLAAYDVAEDPALRQRLAEAHARLATAKAQGVIGHYDEAVALATDVIEQARAAQNGPLEALGLLTRGTYRERTQQGKEAEADLRAAIDIAERNGDQGTRAQALIVLVYVVAQDSERYAEARTLGEQARAVLEYIDADPLLFADLDTNLGVAARLARDFDLALELQRRSHERLVEVLGSNHPDIGRSLLNIGTAMAGSREHDAEAEDYLRRALGRLELALGPQHPTVGTALTNLGNCLARQGRLEEALVLQQRALEVFAGAFGPDHVTTLGVLFNLAKTMQIEGRHAEAAALFRRGLELREAALAVDDERLKGWMSHLAHSELELGHLELGRSLLERSLALRAKDSLDWHTAARVLDQMRLARALAQVDLARARQLAEEVRQFCLHEIEIQGGPEAAPKKFQVLLAETEAWLAANPEVRPDPAVRPDQ